ncbi:MAG: hypothetical protein Q4B17_06960 [Lautropia sp.]|nr:hypothetical protein [Lautropia sp.]
MSAFHRRLPFPLLACLFAVGAWASGVQAHSPRFHCQADGEQVVVCEGGFSDGSEAVGVPIQVLSYDDEPLWEGKLDQQAKIRFERPAGDFYVRFDGGEGHTVEVDQSEIR